MLSNFIIILGTKFISTEFIKISGVGPIIYYAITYFYTWGIVGYYITICIAWFFFVSIGYLIYKSNYFKKKALFLVFLIIGLVYFIISIILFGVLYRSFLSPQLVEVYIIALTVSLTIIYLSKNFLNKGSCQTYRKIKFKNLPPEYKTKSLIIFTIIFTLFFIINVIIVLNLMTFLLFFNWLLFKKFLYTLPLFWLSFSLNFILAIILKSTKNFTTLNLAFKGWINTNIYFNGIHYPFNNYYILSIPYYIIVYFCLIPVLDNRYPIIQLESFKLQYNDFYVSVWADKTYGTKKLTLLAIGLITIILVPITIFPVSIFYSKNPGYYFLFNNIFFNNTASRINYPMFRRNFVCWTKSSYMGTDRYHMTLFSKNYVYHLTTNTKYPENIITNNTLFGGVRQWQTVNRVSRDSYTLLDWEPIVDLQRQSFIRANVATFETVISFFPRYKIKNPYK